MNKQHATAHGNGQSNLKPTPALPESTIRPLTATPSAEKKSQAVTATQEEAQPQRQPEAQPAVPVASQIEQVMKQFQQMERLTKSHKMLKTTSEELGQFDFKPTEEVNNTVTLYITDSKGHRFETRNANLIEPLIQFLQQVLADKTTEVEQELLRYKAPN
ncbi:hypothetical protein [Telluribacter humicola]|uniref:hypothetical protein n=1 Tax=Telluribacter humicola TaxID=1720261 RepID=UPI001A95BFA8|nr:hypothetical protein [Telluribacter humicola]